MANNVPTREEILRRVDEYSLYCYYTGNEHITPGRPFKSPIRGGDDNPSFVVFASNKGAGYEFEYTWVDKAANLFGHIFELVRLLHPEIKTLSEAYHLVATDFDLDLGKPVKAERIVLYEAPPPVSIRLRVHSIPYTTRGLAYWEPWRITQEIRDLYYTKQIDYFWSYDEQLAPTGCYDPTFAYQIGAYHQVYSPKVAKKDKFRNDLPDNYFFGYLQLPPQGEVLVYDKSMKDVMFDRVLGYPAVAGKSETTEIPEKKMLELKERFKTHYLTLDPDEAGKRQTEIYIKKYPWLQPRFLTQAKDKTDLALLAGYEQAESIIKQLLT